jgi:hypothetical protein
VDLAGAAPPVLDGTDGEGGSLGRGFEQMIGCSAVSNFLILGADEDELGLRRARSPRVSLKPDLMLMPASGRSSGSSHAAPAPPITITAPNSRPLIWVRGRLCSSLEVAKGNGEEPAAPLGSPRHLEAGGLERRLDALRQGNRDVDPPVLPR